MCTLLHGGTYLELVLCEIKADPIIPDRFNPLRPSNDVSQTSHCNIKGVSVSEVMRIENMITQVQCY